MEYFVGIDIGSTSAKTVVLDREKQILFCAARPTGWSSVDTAEEIRGVLSEKGYLTNETRCVATGYGRVAVPFADKAVTEITCHARGAVFLHDMQDMTVIDIGGQDTKIIRVADGVVSDFLMNDKCSAGTGRFLEMMANTLGLRPEELVELAANGSGVVISSMCTVFAESEVISLIGRGESRENIASGVVNSIVSKVSSQAGKLSGPTLQVCLTGGLCNFDYIRVALSKALGCPVFSNQNGRYAGAVGAALSAFSVK